MSTSLSEIYDLIGGLLDSEQERVFKRLKELGDDDTTFTILPTNVSELTIDDVVRLVAIASNKHGVASIFAGMARGRADAAEQIYKQKFRQSSGLGSNAAEREANAAAASSKESEDFTLAKLVQRVAEGIESANRVASESARKMENLVVQKTRAENKFDSHASGLSNRDFFHNY